MSRSSGTESSRYTASVLDDVKSRALALQDAAGHYGWGEFDCDPLELTAADIEKRWEGLEA